MRNIAYGSTAILVSDDVADALIHYAAILAMTHTSDLVVVPTVDDAGLAAEATVLLSSGVPLASVHAPEDALAQAAPGFVADLTDRVQAALAGR